MPYLVGQKLGEESRDRGNGNNVGCLVEWK